MKKSIIYVLALVLLVGLVAGCSATPATDNAQDAKDNTADNAADNAEGEEASETGSDSYKIAVLIKSTENPFWAMVSAGVQNRTNEIADEIGAENINVDIIAMDSQTSFEQQISQIEDAVTAGNDAIVICPADGQTVVPAVEEAIKNGVPVIAIQDPINTDAIAAYVAGDTKSACEQIAEHLAQQIDGKGAIGIIRGQQGATIEELRHESFVNYLNENYPEIEVVCEAYADWTAEKAASVMEDFINAHPELTGVFTECDAMAGAAVQVCISDNRTDITVVSTDGNLEQLEQVAKGDLSCTVSLDPMNIGYLGVDTAYKVLSGESVEKEVVVPTVFCTKDENAADEIAKWNSQGF